jgi:hypothetical protein
MFDLDENLRNWRENFQTAEAMRGSDVDELQQHLRDSIAALQSKGLSEEEAFAVATHRIGGSKLLVNEFAKINGLHVRTQRAFWMITGVLLFWVSQIAISALSSIGEVTAALWTGNGVVMATVTIGIILLSWSAIAIGVRKYCFSESGLAWKSVSSTRLTVGVVATIFVGQITVGISRIFLATVAPMSELGRAMLIDSVAAHLLAVILPLILLTVALAMRQRPERSYPA